MAAMAAIPRLFIGQKNYSSWSMRPWILLRAAGFQFVEESVELEGRGFNPRHQAYSPSGTVPCLHMPDGEQVWDSLAISEWLAELSPAGTVWPAAADARAFARCISAEMHGGFGEVRANLPCNFKKRLAGASLSERTQQQVDRILQLWTEARGRFGVPSGAGPYLFGSFGASDAMYAPVVARFISYNVDLSAYPVALEYAAAIAAHPLYREWEAAALKETNPIVHYDETAHRIGGPDRTAKCAIEVAADALLSKQQGS